MADLKTLVLDITDEVDFLKRNRLLLEMALEQEEISVDSMNRIQMLISVYLAQTEYALDEIAIKTMRIRQTAKDQKAA